MKQTIYLLIAQFNILLHLIWIFLGMKRKLPLGTLLVRSVLNYLLWAAFNPENINQDVFSS